MQRVYDNGWVDKGIYEGWYCPRCADFKTERELGPGNTCPIHEIPLEKVREENWFFRLSAFQERLEALYEERPDFVVPDFRRNEAVAFIKRRARGRLALAADPEVGAAAALGPRAADVRLVRRAAQLLHRARLRPRGRGPDRALLAGRPARDGEGHPQVPRGDLAGAAAGRRPRAAAADDDPRLPADGREKDVEVARQRARPVRGDRPLRRRRAALLPASARSASARTARSRPPASRPATRPSSPTTTATSPAGCWRWSTATATATVPEAAVDAVLAEDFEGVVPRFCELLDRAELTQALEEAWKLVRRLNRYVEETQPWELAKDEADPERLDEVLYNLVEGLRVTTLLLVPYLPRRRARRCSRRSAKRAASWPSSARARAARASSGSRRCSRRSKLDELTPPWVGRLRLGPGRGIRAELVGAGEAAERHRQVELGEDHLQHRFDARPGRPAPGPRCRGGRGRPRRRRARAP